MEIAEERISGAEYPRGEYQDRLVGPDGSVIWEEPWKRNLIVDRLRNLLAALIKGDSQGAPLGFWAVGRGDDSWDNGPVPADAARRALTKLVGETGRKPVAPGQVTFIGGTFTNRLEITAQFTSADLLAGPANQRLREFGLFAGGTAAADSGVLINHRIHPRIDMQPGFTLERTLRLTF